MKLFAFYIGGKTETSFIEVHDVRFAIAETAEDCYPNLRKQWWGTPTSLHIDCCGALEHIEGYEIELKREAYAGSEKLYFVNLGGYDPEDFSELHRNVFVVAENEGKVKRKAIQSISSWKLPHKDNLLNIENIFNLNNFAENEGLHIHLTKTEEMRPFSFVADYTSIADK